jgi:lipopolysaccharide export system permease protein
VLKIIDRYVLRQVMLPLVTSFSIGLLMLLAERMVRLLDTTLGKRNSFGVVFELLAYLVPHYLGTAVPAALFLGLLFGFNRLSKNQELDAMFAAGFGLHRLARPTLILALIFCAASMAIFGWFQPYTRYAYRAVLFDVKNIDSFYLAEEGVFMQSGNRTFILNGLNRNQNTFEQVFIFEDKGADGIETLTATSGELVTVDGALRPVLRLTNGRRLALSKGKDGEFEPGNSGSFDVLDTPLGRVTKDLFRARGNDERELTLPELLSQQAVPPKGSTRKSMRAEFHRRAVNIVAMLLLPFLALPFAMGRPRSPRAYRIGVALIILIGFHEIIEQGALASKASGYSPWATMWLPLLLLGVFSMWRFYRASFIVGADTDSRLSTWLQGRVGPLWRNLRRKLSGGSAA